MRELRQIASVQSVDELRVPPRRINEIVHGKRAVTADTALRLGKYFGVSAQFWLNLQTQYDLDVAEDRLSLQIDAITPLRVA